MMQYTNPKARYHVAEHGNGWAYTVTDQETGDSFFVQDDAAAQLQHESDGFCDEEVLGNYMDGHCDRSRACARLLGEAK